MVGGVKPERASRNSVRFSVNTVLMTMALIATLLAAETNRYRNQSILEKSMNYDSVDHVNYSQRFKGIDPDGLFASCATKLFGRRWNQVLISVAINDDEKIDEFVTSVASLKHVRTVAFHELELDKRQIAKLKKMKSLQWLCFVNTNVDQASLESLRKALPNTFVCGFDYP